MKLKSSPQVATIRKAIYEKLCSFDAIMVPKRHRALAPAWREALRHWLVEGDARTWVVRKGRRIGASTVMCPRLIAAWILVAGPLLDLPPGEQCTIGLVSIKRSEAENRQGQITACFDALDIEYDFAGGAIVLRDLPIAIKVLTRDWRLVIGETIGLLWCDEVSRWESDDDSANAASEVVSSLTPSLASIPTSLIALVSSPWSEVDYHAECYGRGDTKYQTTAFLPTAMVIPELSEEVTQGLEPDPDKHAREYLAIPSGTVSCALDPADVNAMFANPSIRATSGFLAIDASSLRRDGFAWVAGQYCRQGIHIAEVHELGREVRQLKMQGVVQRVATRARAWRVNVVYADQREAAGLESLFAIEKLRFIFYAWSEPSKEAAFSLLRQLMRDRRISILNDSQSALLRTEMLKCKAFLMPSGRTKYATTGLDRLSALVTLCHAINEKQIQVSEAGAIDWADWQKKTSGLVEMFGYHGGRSWGIGT